MHAIALDHGWAWVVLAGGFGVNMLCGFMVYGIGVFHIALLETYKEDVSRTAWVGSLVSALLCLMGPFAGALVNVTNCRVVVMAGGVLIVIGYASSSFVSSLNLLMLTYGVLVGCGTGLSYTASMIAISYNFQKKRNLANGIAVTGAGLGMFAGAPVVEFLLTKYGLSGTLLLCGGIGFHMVLFGVLHKPSVYEIKVHVQSQQFQSSNKLTVNNSVNQLLILVKNIPFVIFSIGYMIWTIGFFIALIHTPACVIFNGFSEKQGSFVIALMGIGSLISRPIVGMATNSEDISEIILYFGSLGIVSIITFVLPLFSHSYVGFMIFGVVYGIYVSGLHSLNGPIVIQLVGVKNLSQAFGVLMFAGGVGGLIGPPLAGMIVDYGGTYEQGFVLAGLTFLIGSFSGMLSCCLMARQKDVGDDFTRDGINIEQIISASRYSLAQAAEEERNLQLSIPNEISRIIDVDIKSMMTNQGLEDVRLENTTVLYSSDPLFEHMLADENKALTCGDDTPA